MMHWDMGPTPPPPQDSRHVAYPSLPLLLTSGGHHWRSVQTCSLVHLPPPPSPPLLTSSDGHPWQAGGKHPTGMHSCRI